MRKDDSIPARKPPAPPLGPWQNAGFYAVTGTAFGALFGAAWGMLRGRNGGKLIGDTISDGINCGLFSGLLGYFLGERNVIEHGLKTENAALRHELQQARPSFREGTVTENEPVNQR